MNLTKRKSSRQLSDIQNEMSRLLEDAFTGFGIAEIGSLRTWYPSIELRDQDGNYELKAELPGIKKDNIDLEIGEDTVTINAETEKEEEEKRENAYTSEFRYGKFTRTVQLPGEVDNSNAKAEFKDGILTVTLPKTHEEETRIKKIKIED